MQSFGRRRRPQPDGIAVRQFDLAVICLTTEANVKF
jgi:hypothetical protein